MSDKSLRNFEKLEKGHYYVYTGGKTSNWTEGMDAVLDHKIHKCTFPPFDGNTIARKVFRQRVNEFLVTEFTFEEIETIYTYLGNDIKRKLCETFVRKDYDMNVIYDYERKEIKEKA